MSSSDTLGSNPSQRIGNIHSPFPISALSDWYPWFTIGIQTGDNPRSYKCRFCPKSCTNTTGGWSSLQAHWDRIKGCTNCAGWKKSMAKGLALPSTWREIHHSAPLMGPVENFVSKERWHLEIWERMMVWWLVRHTLPFSCSNDPALRAAFAAGSNMGIPSFNSTIWNDAAGYIANSKGKSVFCSSTFRSIHVWKILVKFAGAWGSYGYLTMDNKREPTDLHCCYSHPRWLQVWIQTPSLNNQTGSMGPLPPWPSWFLKLTWAATEILSGFIKGF